MAHHKDAKKRIRQNVKKQARNKDMRTFYRNRIKDVKAAVEAGDAVAAETALGKAISAIDRAVTKSILHKNTGSRYKSRLSKAVKGVKSSDQPAQA